MVSTTAASAAGRNPAVLPVPAYSRAIAGAALSPASLRHMVAQQVVGSPIIERLISHPPAVGGTWHVGSARAVRFAAPGVVAIDYEDGHLAGRLVLRIEAANVPRTWVVLEDRPR